MLRYQMEAGSDTTSSTLLSFILAVIEYPQVLKKAQEEVDGLCGVARSPSSEDIDKLPFLRACMTEVNFCNPTVTSVNLPVRH